jgi:hypothetical protein
VAVETLSRNLGFELLPAKCRLRGDAIAATEFSLADFAVTRLLHRPFFRGPFAFAA